MKKQGIHRISYKYLILFVCLNILLTGCMAGGSGQTDVGNLPKDTYKINWYMPNGMQPDMDIVNAEMNKITIEKINASLNVEYIDWGSYEQKIKVKMASAVPMDLMFTSNWSNDFITGVNKGAFSEISREKLKTLAPNVLDGVPEKCWPAAMVKGKLYAIINTQVEGRTPGFVGLKKYFDKYGFDAKSVTKLSDLTPLLEKIKAGEPGVIPFGLTGLNNTYNDYALTYGIELFSKENPGGLYINDNSLKVMNYFAAPETKEYLKLIHDWYVKGYIRKDAPTVKDDINDRKAGKIAIVPICVNPDSTVNMAVQFNARPEEMLGQAIYKTFMSTGSISATMTAISKTSQNPDKCYMLYNLLYDRDDTKLFNMLNYGIEGRHYTRKNDVVTPVRDSGYWVACGWENGNMFNSYRQSDEQPLWYPAGPEINNTAETSRVLGFSFNPDPVKVELMQCTFVVNEFYDALFTGAVDPDSTLPVFLERLNKAGAVKVIAEMQKQINNWKSIK